MICLIYHIYMCGCEKYQFWQRNRLSPKNVFFFATKFLVLRVWALSLTFSSFTSQHFLCRPRTKARPVYIVFLKSFFFSHYVKTSRCCFSDKIEILLLFRAWEPALKGQRLESLFPLSTLKAMSARCLVKKTNIHLTQPNKSLTYDINRQKYLILKL